MRCQNVIKGRRRLGAGVLQRTGMEWHAVTAVCPHGMLPPAYNQLLRSSTPNCLRCPTHLLSGMWWRLQRSALSALEGTRSLLAKHRHAETELVRASKPQVIDPKRSCGMLIDSAFGNLNQFIVFLRSICHMSIQGFATWFLLGLLADHTLL